MKQDIFSKIIKKSTEHKKPLTIEKLLILNRNFFTEYNNSEETIPTVEESLKASYYIKIK